MLAFVATKRWAHARRLLDALRGHALRAPDLHAAVYDAALPVCEAFVAFGQGRYRLAAHHLQAQQRLVRGCGGSRAQCDLLHLTWLEAALRSHQPALARQLLGERIASRPLSPYNERLRERIAQAPSRWRAAARRTVRRVFAPAPACNTTRNTAAIGGCMPDTNAGQTACHAVTHQRQSGAGPARALGPDFRQGAAL